jgi:outer membrane lipoprotein-sorting protein
MRKLIVSFILATLACSCLWAQNLDQILSDHFRASAQDKKSGITTMTTKGQNGVAAMGIEMGFTLYQSRPSKLRVEADFAGTKIIQTFNGATGWTYAPLMGITQPQELGNNDIRALLNQVEMDSPLWNYKTKGKTVELLGSSTDGKDFIIRVVSAKGEESTLFINKGTSLISKFVITQVDNGMESKMETEMKDYRNVEGIPVPYSIVSKISGVTVNTITVESVEFNNKLDPALFEKPVVQ